MNDAFDQPAQSSDMHEKRNASLTRRMMLAAACVTIFVAPAPGFTRDKASAGLRVATFSVDATPPLGYPLDEVPVARIRDPLSARGIVILGSGSPIVLATVDWRGIDQAARDEWHLLLAKAANTTPDRVSVHHLHQHEAPRGDLGTDAELLKRGLPVQTSPAGVPDRRTWTRGVMQASAKALGESLARAQPFTHVGTGRARVERIASNRVVVGADGKVLTRLSAWNYTPLVLEELRERAEREGYRLSPFHVEEARNAPEGVIDPDVRVLSLWNGDKPVVALNYYATHPQVTVGTGVVSSEFVGLARTRRERETGVFQLYFTGAGGNVTAGKYNDGSDQARIEMTDRLADAMRRAWSATDRRAVGIADIQWRTTVAYMPSKYRESVESVRAVADDEQRPVEERVGAARKLYRMHLMNSGARLAALKIGDAYSLFMKGEMFVEYQLAAQQMRPQDFVAFAGYGGQYGYIGTSSVYAYGGYEAGVSWTTAGAEPVFMDAMRRLLY